MNISGLLQKEANRLLMPYKLNQQQFSILFEIVRAKEVMQKNMVNKLQLEKAHVSKVVKKLSYMGLISVIPSTSDKRSLILKPTEEGEKLLGVLQVLFGQWRQEFFVEFTKKEMAEILETVSKLQKTIMDE